MRYTPLYRELRFYDFQTSTLRACRERSRSLDIAAGIQSGDRRVLVVKNFSSLGFRGSVCVLRALSLSLLLLPGVSGESSPPGTKARHLFDGLFRGE